MAKVETADQIRDDIRKIWPKIQFVWMQDGFYVRPSISEIEAVIKQSDVVHLRFNGEVMDCDDYALLLNAFVKRFRVDRSDSLPAAENFHYAFGEAFGNKFNRVDNIHTLNICAAEDGIYIVEPQTYDIRKASENDDNILIVKM